MDRRPTSRDVARAAGVSQSTVSFVFTGREGISASTRDRVLRAAAELNYRPNLAARSMRTQRTGRLAIVIPSVSTLDPLPIFTGATSAAHDAGYVVEIVSLPHTPEERARRLDDLVDSGEYEGILSFTPLRTLPRQEGRTVVLSLSEFDEAMHMTGAFTDARPVVELMERLVALGHRRFLHIAGPLDYPSAVARRDAFRSTVERLGLESLGVFQGNWSGAAGFDAIASLPDEAPPLAVIAANDVIATGAIRAAALRGWSMPGDMSITGWDDLDTSAFLVPPLTSVIQDREALGAHSMRRLLAAIRGDEPPVLDTGLQRVVWRESTGAPRG